MAPASATSRKYRAGDLAPVSGIYSVHQELHRPSHEALVIRGEEFPPCRTCQLGVWFQAIRQVSHLTHDMDFAGRVLSVLQRRDRKNVTAAG